MAKFDYWLSEDGLTLLQGWARAGLTDEQIAHNCHINISTLREWRIRFPPVSTALKEGKQVIDILVENALLKRALGYDYIEQTIEESEKNGTTTKVYHKHMAPDVVAQIYWLKNRKRDMWKDSHDKVEIERERVEIEKKRLDMDTRQHSEGQGPKTINIIVEPDAEDWGD
jgi:hypothetical protein